MGQHSDSNMDAQHSADILERRYTPEGGEETMVKLGSAAAANVVP